MSVFSKETEAKCGIGTGFDYRHMLKVIKYLGSKTPILSVWFQSVTTSLGFLKHDESQGAKSGFNCQILTQSRSK